jgi:hypothetical protein
MSGPVIGGTLTCRADAQTLTLRTGPLLTPQAGIRHAVEESAFILTLAAEAPHPIES